MQEYEQKQIELRIQKKIMKELEGIPISKLNELYEFIYYFKLGLLTDWENQEKEYCKNEN